MSARRTIRIISIWTILAASLLIAQPTWGQSKYPQGGNGAAPITGNTFPKKTTVNPHSKVFHRFLRAYSKAQSVEAHAIQTVRSIMSKSPLSRRQFVKIQSTLANQGMQNTSALPSKERKEYSRVSGKINKVEQSTQKQVANSIKSEGISLGQFYQIMHVVEHSPKLLKRLQSHIKRHG